MIYYKPYIRIYENTVYIDTSELTRRKTLVKSFFASPLIPELEITSITSSTKDDYFADNNVLNLNTASRPPLLVNFSKGLYSGPAVRNKILHLEIWPFWYIYF